MTVRGRGPVYSPGVIGRGFVRWTRDIVLVASAIAIAIAGGLALQLNATTIALVLITVVVALSAWRGPVSGVVASLIATASLNFFFLPPRRTWTIDDPGNWIALACFLAASLLASRLMARVRAEADNARARQSEIESLYQFSLELTRATSRPGSLATGIDRALASAGTDAGGVVALDSSPYRQNRLVWRGVWREEMEDLVASAARHRRQIEFGWPGRPVRDVYLPLLGGGHVIGVLVVLGTSMPETVLESIATLVTLALERERLAHEHAHVEALRESEAAKTTLLRAASHDLVTPLTAIAIQAGRLIRLADPKVRPIAESLGAESDRLRRRIENLLAMARLQAGAFVATPEPTPAADLFRAAREALAALLRSRTVNVIVAETCPDLWADPALALEIVVNLVENAHRATPPEYALDLSAYPDPAGAPRVVLEVADRGAGFDLHGESRGLGLEIVQGLAHAIGAAVEFTDRSDGGLIARLDVPAAVVQPAAEVGE